MQSVGNCMLSAYFCEQKLGARPLKLKEIMSLGTCQKLAGREGAGSFKFGFENEVTHPCNGNEIF